MARASFGGFVPGADTRVQVGPLDGQTGALSHGISNIRYEESPGTWSGSIQLAGASACPFVDGGAGGDGPGGGLSSIRGLRPRKAIQELAGRPLRYATLQ